MNVQCIATQPIAGMKPGTSGLRKRVAESASGLYLAHFVQSVFHAVRPADGFAGHTLVVGGLADLIALAAALAELRARTGRAGPDVMT
jgi:phosphoglucomutase